VLDWQPRMKMREVVAGMVRARREYLQAG
jgi:hypothetical protein